MRKLTKTVQQMVDEARQRIVNLTPAEARRRVVEENALLVDIRDVRELQRDGMLAGALHAPRGMLEFWVDPESPYFKEVFAEEREFILFCAAGGRSSLAAQTLQDMGLPKVSHIVTGFHGWQEDGLPVEAYVPRKR
jgi:rhodanese-related sulfurtransferase